MNCPHCGNANCNLVSETTTTGKDFSASKGCCGALLFGPIGILCGACGKGRQTSTEHYWICQNCGYKFKA